MRSDHPTIKIDEREKASGSKDESSSDHLACPSKKGWDTDPYQGTTGKARQQSITNALFNARMEPTKKVSDDLAKQIVIFTLLNTFTVSLIFEICLL